MYKEWQSLRAIRRWGERTLGLNERETAALWAMWSFGFLEEVVSEIWLYKVVDI